MSDDVEKVARAMWMASRPINPAGILNWDAMLDEYKEQWRVYARAALSALGGWNEAIEAAAHTVKTPYSGEQDDITREAMDRAAARIRALRRPATGEGDQPRKAGE